MKKDVAFQVLIVSTKKILFEGKAHQLILPGEKGVFEILPYHKPLLSRLITGYLIMDGQRLHIHRGIVKVDHNKTSIILEED